MFQEIMIKEPIEKIVDDWDFFDEKVLKKFTGFKDIGTNIIGVRQRVVHRGHHSNVGDPKKGNIGVTLEMGPNGITRVDHRPLTVRVTTAGTPHHAPHNYGYWHINDKDELYIQIPAEIDGELGRTIVLMGMPTGNETDGFAWYCEHCMTQLYEKLLVTGQTGLPGFWAAEAAAVRVYNSDVRHRTCPECNHVNPLGYCWNAAKDTPEEAAARLAW